MCKQVTKKVTTNISLPVDFKQQIWADETLCKSTCNTYDIVSDNLNKDY